MHCFIDVDWTRCLYKRRMLYNLKIRMPLLYFCLHEYKCPLVGMLCLYYFNAFMLKFAHVQFIVFYVFSCTKTLDVPVYLWCTRSQLLWTTEQHGPYISCFSGFPISEYTYCVVVPGLYNHYSYLSHRVLSCCVLFLSWILYTLHVTFLPLYLCNVQGGVVVGGGG